MPVRTTQHGTFMVVETRGFREFSRALADYEPKLRRELKREIVEVAQPIVAKARGNAAQMRKSGDMEASIRVTVLRTGIRIQAGGGKAPYAPVIEFAHKGKGGGLRRSQRSTKSGLRGIKGGVSQKRDYSSLTSRYGNPPRYLFRAVEQTERATFERIDRTVQRSMRNFWERHWEQEH